MKLGWRNKYKPYFHQHWKMNDYPSYVPICSKIDFVDRVLNERPRTLTKDKWPTIKLRSGLKNSLIASLWMSEFQVLHKFSTKMTLIHLAFLPLIQVFLKNEINAFNPYWQISPSVIYGNKIQIKSLSTWS